MVHTEFASVSVRKSGVKVLLGSIFTLDDEMG